MTEYLLPFLCYDHYYYYYCRERQIQLDLKFALREENHKGYMTPTAIVLTWYK